jgi:hypothetical protein
MWKVNKVEFRPHQLDFASSGLGIHPTTAVVADGLEIVNGMDLLDTAIQPLQILVCGHCGTPGCGSGNRVLVRRLEEGVVLVPAFEYMSRGPWELSEYSPPYFMERNGVPWFKGPALAELAREMPLLADPGCWPPLTMREAALLLQWEAPNGALAKFPEAPVPRSEAVAAVTHGEDHATIAELARILALASSDSRPAKLVQEEPVTFYLETGLSPDEWKPLTTDGVTFRIALAEGLGVSAADT